MGTQQLLMIVLSIVIVGIAISVGIFLFNHFSYRSNIQAILAELQHFATLSKAYWGAPESRGGASRKTDNCDIGVMASYLGFKEDYGSKTIQITYKYISPNGEFHLDSTWDGVIEISVLGSASLRGKHPYISYKYDMITDSPTIEIEAKKGWEDL
ncbi:MAG TPA: hypothetical protein PKI59_00935 [Candidatus Cloacimonadota bacterium]|nr:hypothetical protein [Candidatus Cloacimonadota bacterium]